MERERLPPDRNESETAVSNDARLMSEMIEDVRRLEASVRSLERGRRVRTGRSTRQIDAIRREALEVFGSREKADAWLERPTRPLGDLSPLELLGEPNGERKVRTLLGRISHGLSA